MSAPTPAPTPRAARRWRRVALLGVLLGVLTPPVCELALRIARPFPLDPPLYPGDVAEDAQVRGSTRLDPDLGWRFEPNAVVADRGPDFELEYRCDADGFRATAAREDAERSVLFVGDSFTFGVGVAAEDSFVERFADEITGVQAHNLGMAGYGVDQMLCALREVGLARQPDLVIAVFVLDDFTRSTTAYRYRNGWMRKPTFVLEDDALVELTEANAPGAVRRWFEQSFALSELVRRAARRAELEWGFGARLELNLRLLVEMNALCQARGVEFAALHLPQRGAWKPLTALAEPLARAGVPFLDLGAAPIDSPGRLYFPKDPHFNAQGHALVAERLAAFVGELGWRSGAGR